MTVKGKHTPGPWKVYHAALRPQFSSNKIIEIQSDHAKAIVQWMGFDDSDRSKKTHLANAQLMAAAPDMLAALKAVAPIVAREGDGEAEQAAYDALCVAIAKAEGK